VKILISIAEPGEKLAAWCRHRQKSFVLPYLLFTAISVSACRWS